MCSQNRLKNGIMLIGKIVPLRLKAAFIEECLTFLCKWKTKCFSPLGSSARAAYSMLIGATEVAQQL